MLDGDLYWHALGTARQGVEPSVLILPDTENAESCASLESRLNSFQYTGDGVLTEFLPFLSPLKPLIFQDSSSPLLESSLSTSPYCSSHVCGGQRRVAKLAQGENGRSGGTAAGIFLCC